jgi:hypothetical protein
MPALFSSESTAGRVIVWLWDADGPNGSASGVTGDQGAACRAASESMAVTGASTATVEAAAHLSGGGWMSSGYRRTGHRWAARRHGSHVTWTEIPRCAEAAS